MSKTFKQSTSPLKVLIKFASKGRPEAFTSCMVKLYSHIADLKNTTILITHDENDSRLSDYFDSYSNEIGLYDMDIIWVTGESKNKVAAINRDMEEVKDWDILINTSDDMVWHQKGFDDIIRKDFLEHYPDLDGVLHYPDGYTQERLISLSIMGRKYYDRFGYIYHPDYISLWADNEFTEAAKLLGKYTYIDKDLYKHEHPANNAEVKTDEGYRHTESFYHIDHETFKRRKYELNFDLI